MEKTLYENTKKTASNRGRITWITRTAVLLALLIVMQAATAPLANTIVTGSLVNLILIVSVMISGLSSGFTIAVCSPALAKLFGIGPLWSILPFVALGNASLVFVWHLIGNRKFGNQLLVSIITLITAAITKFVVLYIGVVKIALPVLLALPEPQTKVISNMFSVPQLFTAGIGGIIAALILPKLKKVVSKDL